MTIIGYLLTAGALLLTVMLTRAGEDKLVLPAACLAEAALFLAAVVASRQLKGLLDALVGVLASPDKLTATDLERSRTLFRSLAIYAVVAGVVVAVFFMIASVGAGAVTDLHNGAGRALKALAIGVVAGGFVFYPLAVQVEQKISLAGGRPQSPQHGEHRGGQPQPSHGPDRHQPRPQPSGDRGRTPPPGSSVAGTPRPGQPQPNQRPGTQPAGGPGGEHADDRGRGHQRRRRGNREFRDRNRGPNPTPSPGPAPTQTAPASPPRPESGTPPAFSRNITQPGLPGTAGNATLPLPAPAPRPAPVTPTPLED